MTIRKAHIGEYLAWLSGYLSRGGKITHFYDYPFSNFLFADENVLVDGNRECGARSRHIIVKSGFHAVPFDPRTHFGGWGHTSIYLMDGFTVPSCSQWVPVYSDQEFDAIISEDDQLRREMQNMRDRELWKRARGL